MGNVSEIFGMIVNRPYIQKNVPISGTNVVNNSSNTVPVSMKSKEVNNYQPRDKRLNIALQDLVRVIVEGEQDNFPAAWQKYCNAVDAVCNEQGELAQEDVLALARDRYFQATGRNIIDDIRKNSHGSFTQGLINGVTFGLFGQKITAEDNISLVTGLPKSKTSGTVRKAGSVAGGVASGAVIGGSIGSVLPGVGTAIGAAAGAAVGGFIGLFE